MINFFHSKAMFPHLTFFFISQIKRLWFGSLFLLKKKKNRLKMLMELEGGNTGDALWCNPKYRERREFNFLWT